MNGRVYDPTVGRFLSVDPMFQSPTNSQSVNPYSYVMNNPLSLVDPSGYAAACPGGPASDQSSCGNREDQKEGDKQPKQRVYKGHNDHGSMDHLAGTKQANYEKAMTKAVAAVQGHYGAKSGVGIDTHGNAVAVLGNGDVPNNQGTNMPGGPSMTGGSGETNNEKLSSFTTKMLGQQLTISMQDSDDDAHTQGVYLNKMIGAVDLINHAQLTTFEQDMIKNISAIRVLNDTDFAKRGVIPQWRNWLTLTQRDVRDASLPFLGSAFAHDGYHFNQFSMGLMDQTPGIRHAMELTASEFQIEVGAKLGSGLNQDEIDTIHDYETHQ